jgi:transcriptional regulator with XRE-family HTH domain
MSGNLTWNVSVSCQPDTRTYPVGMVGDHPRQTSCGYAAHMTDRQPDAPRRHIADLNGQEAQFNQDLGERVRLQRTAAGMTQEQLAAAVGVARGSIANLERGAQAPTAFRLAKLATALHCDLDKLVPAPTATMSATTMAISNSHQNAVALVLEKSAKKVAKAAR